MKTEQSRLVIVVKLVDSSEHLDDGVKSQSIFADVITDVNSHCS